MRAEKILLVGGDGFIGKNLYEQLRKCGKNVLSIDKKYEDLRYSNKKLINKLTTTTDVFILASEVGAKAFNTNPIELYQNNKLILENVYNAIKYIYEKYNRKLNVSWFSTSEIYGNIDKTAFITDNTTIKLDLNNKRSLYSIVKIIGEYLFTDLYHCGYINSLNVYRLFNISGKYQQRGVLYDMVKSAIDTKSIYFCDKTTRTITSIKYAIKTIIETARSNKNGIQNINIHEERNSLYLKDLAKIVKNTIEDEYNIKNIKLIKKPVDNFIQYRHTAIPNVNRCDENEIKHCIYQILEDFQK
jgi:nucleoside-diphosphate-sugar epimerase